MFDTQPLPSSSERDWFFYFRLSKHLPAMGLKYAEADKIFSSDAATQLKIRTAFVAAGIDIIWRNFTALNPQELINVLTTQCQVSPPTLTGIKVANIAVILDADQTLLERRLKTIGFTIDANGVVAGHHAPAAPRGQSPRIQGPKPF